MLKSEMISELTRQISDKLSGAGLPGEAEMKSQVQRVAESVFSKLNLVTREEFDIQNEVLLRTRSKVDALEAQVQALEATLKALCEQTPKG